MGKSSWGDADKNSLNVYLRFFLNRVSMMDSSSGSKLIDK